MTFRGWGDKYKMNIKTGLKPVNFYQHNAIPLPTNIKNATSLKVFTDNLKVHYIAEYT